MGQGRQVRDVGGHGVRLLPLHLIRLTEGNHGRCLCFEISREVRIENWKLVVERFCPTFYHSQRGKPFKGMKERNQIAKG